MTLYECAAGARLPWRSTDAGTPAINTLPQQEIDVCLMCQHHANACDRCDGSGNLKRAAHRPPKEYDAALLRDMLRLRKCNAEMCAALGLSKNTLAKAKKRILQEERS